MKGVSLLQMEDSPVSDTEGDDDPLISLNAITDLSSTETMQLHIKILESTLTALVDSGLTHSISAAAACRLAPRPDLTVAIIDDDRVTNEGVCCATRVVIGSEEFILDLFVIPLNGFDMVLGFSGCAPMGQSSGTLIDAA
jgi:hypothetical protein